MTTVVYVVTDADDPVAVFSTEAAADAYADLLARGSWDGPFELDGLVHYMNAKRTPGSKPPPPR